MSKKGLEVFALGIGFVIENEEFLREEYGEEFIAVYGDRIIDYDGDESRLLRRLPNKDGIVTGTIDDIASMPEEKIR